MNLVLVVKANCLIINKAVLIVKRALSCVFHGVLQTWLLAWRSYHKYFLPKTFG